MKYIVEYLYVNLHFVQQLNFRWKRKYRAHICKTFKEPRNRFPALRDGTTTLFVVPARQAA
jgi:hypothetical protein